MATEREIVFRVRIKDFEKLFSNLDELEKDISKVNTVLKQTDNAQNIGALTTELAALKAQQKQVNTEIRVQTKLFQGLDEAKGSFKSIKAEADFLKNALKGLGKDTNLDEFQQRLEELLPSTKSLNLETLDFEQTQRALATRIVDNQVAMKEFNKSISANAQVLEFAEGSYKKLQQQTGSLSKELRLLGDELPEGDLRQLQKRLEEIEPRLKKHSLSTKDLTQTKDILSRQINENNVELSDFNRNLSASDELVGEYSRGILNAFGKLGLTDNLEKGLQSLNSQKKLLNEQLKQSVKLYDSLDDKGSESANAIRREITRLNTTLDKTDSQIDEINKSLKNSAAETKAAFGGIQSTLNAGLGLFVAQVGLQGADDVIQQLKDISDAEADAAKTTNLTISEIRELNKELKKIDTRTQEKDLLALVAAGGKLGQQGADNLLRFAESADKIKVALGEDLGGDDAIKSIAKLVEIFNITDDFPINEALLKAGSVINSLGAAGTANEQFIVDFLRRTAGAAKTVKVSFEELAATGAVLDEIGQNNEAAASAYQALLIEVAKNQERFTSLVVDGGFATAEGFKELLSNSPAEALNLVLESVKSSEEGFNSLADTLAKSGIESNRAAGIITALSQNVDKLRKSQEFSRKEFEKGDSVLKEFETKNNNLAAVIEKVKKEIASVFTDSGFLEEAEGAGTAILALARNASGLSKFLLANKDVIKALIVVYAGYRTVLLASNAATIVNTAAIKLENLALRLNRADTLAASGAKVTMAAASGNLRTAVLALWTAMKANPLGLITVAVGAVVGAFIILNREQSNTVAKYKSLQKASKEISQKFTNEKRVLDQLFKSVREGIKAAGDDVQAKAKQARAIDTINGVYGKYLPNLLTEKTSIDELEKSYKSLNKQLLNNIVTEARKAEADQLLQRSLEVQREITDINKQGFANTTGFFDGVSETLGQIANLDFTAYTEGIDSAAIKQREEELAKINKDLKELNGTFIDVEKRTLKQFENLNLTEIFGEDGGSEAAGNLGVNLDQTKTKLENLQKAYVDLKQKQQESDDLNEKQVIGKELKKLEKNIKTAGGSIKKVGDDTRKALEGSINFLKDKISELNEELGFATTDEKRFEIEAKIKVAENALSELEGEAKEKVIELPVKIEVLDKEIEELKEKLKSASETDKIEILSELKLKSEELDTLKTELSEIEDFEILLKIKVLDEEKQKLEQELSLLEDKEVEIKTRITEINETVTSATTVSDATGVPVETFELTFAKQQLEELQDSLDALQSEKTKIEVEIETTQTGTAELETGLSEDVQAERIEVRKTAKQAEADAILEIQQEQKAKEESLREEAFASIEFDSQREINIATQAKSQKLLGLLETFDNELITEEQYRQQRELAEQEHQDRLAEIQLEKLNDQSTLVEEGSIEFLTSQAQINDLEFQQLQTQEQRKRDEIQRTVDYEKALQNARLDLIGTFVSGAKDLLSQDESNRKKYAAVIKALSIGEIVLNTVREVSAINANPLVNADISQALRITLTGAAITRAAIATAKVLSQKFKKGGVINGKTPVGQTTDNGYVDSEGVAHGDRHKDSEKEPGGIGVMVGGQRYEIEDGEMIVENNGEVIILNRNVGSDAALRQKVWSIRDHVDLTPQQKKEKLSKINEENGGDSFVGERAHSYSFAAQNRPDSIQIPSISAMLGVPTAIPYGIITRTIETQTSNKQVVESSRVTGSQMMSMSKKIQENIEGIALKIDRKTDSINKRIDRIEVNLFVGELSKTQNSIKVKAQKGRI